MGRIEPFFETVLEEALQSSFLRQIAGKYHYPKEEYDTLERVIGEVVKGARREAAWQWIDKSWMDTENKESDDAEFNIKFPCEKIVLMTLGREVDRLQENYSEKGMLTEAYMVEVAAGEILLKGYQALNRFSGENGHGYVKRYFFFGSDANHPMESIPEYVKNFRLSVSVNQSFYMTPKKTVLFSVLLEEENREPCPGICMGCDSKDCPNRMNVNWQGMLARLPEGPLSYGYAQILGIK